MELAEAWDKIQRILVEERVHPTVEYYDRIFELKKDTKPWNEELQDLLKRWNKLYTQPRLNLTKDREFRPRHVHEFPGEYLFRSKNFELLTVVFGQVDPETRSEIVSILTQHLSDRNCFVKTEKENAYPSYRYMVSEFPLVAEFVVRHGYAKELFKALSDLNNPTIPLAILFLALEDMIALNFTLFSDEELKQIPRQLQPLLKYFGDIAKADSVSTKPATKDSKERGPVAREICDSIRGILEECRTARHYYLSEQLLSENPNLEIEGDKKKLRDSLASLGFDLVLIQTLRKAEDLYKPTSDGFDLKSCIGHLRSFLEILHRDSAAAVAAQANETGGSKWGEWILYLRQKGIFTVQHEQFVAALYTLMSDKSVHPLTADREYARLLRNMLVEYGVMFLATLTKNGVKIS